MNRTLRKIHKWVGLILLLLFFIQGTTGVIMANKDSLVTAIPNTTSPQTAELDRLVKGIKVLYPTYDLERIIYPDDATHPLIARVESNDEFWISILYMNRQSGEVLSHGPLWQYPGQLAERVHVALLMGEPGFYTVLIEGLLLTFMAISGVIIWWPRNGKIFSALKIKSHLGIKRLVRDIHVIPAVIFAPFMVLSAVSGSLILSEPFLKPIIAVFTSVSPDVDPEFADIGMSVDGTSWQESMIMLEKHFDDGSITQLRFPLGERLLLAVIHADRPLNPRAHHIAGVDRFTGETLVLSDANNILVGDEILEWLLPIHSGDIWGPFRVVLQSLLGSLLVGLSITGLIIWWQRRPAQAKKR